MRLSKEALAQAGNRARELYEGGIRDRVEPEHNGEYLVLNLETGEYVVGQDWIATSDDAKARFPKSPRFLIRVGHPAAIKFGFRGVG